MSDGVHELPSPSDVLAPWQVERVEAIVANAIGRLPTAYPTPRPVSVTYHGVGKARSSIWTGAWHGFTDNGNAIVEDAGGQIYVRPADEIRFLDTEEEEEPNGGDGE